jgi:thiamine biosynthesis lipoprotein ApbE
MTSATQGVGRKDYWALGSLLVGAGIVLLRPAPASGGSDANLTAATEPAVRRFEASSGSAASEMRGGAFGTTWCVKVRDAGWKPDGLDARIAAEIDRIEARLSHWKPDSATSQFNTAATVLEMDVEPELAKLVSLAARVSDRTGGMFDITVAPLVSLWGHGPMNASAAQS